MARIAKKLDVAEEVGHVRQEIYVFERNFGLIIDRVHKFWAQGAEVLAEEEAELLALLRRHGAPLALKK